MLIGYVVWQYCVALFVIEIMRRLSKVTSLLRKSGLTHHLDLLVKLSNPLYCVTSSARFWFVDT